jgi:molybdopterin-guanine dinucleotide biosynthesis protein A
VRVIADAAPFAGPLAALADALLEARGQIAVVVGGDMPGLVPKVLRLMVDRLIAESEADAVVLGPPGDSPPEARGTERRRQVLPIALRVGKASAAARQALDGGDRSLRALLDRLACEEIPPARWLGLDPSAATLLDVDTRADLERLQASESARDLP